MIEEALQFWNAISGKVKRVVKDETRNAFRCERYEVTTAPNGTTIGVTLPMGTREIFLPYSQEVASATVGQSVLVVWWGSMSNAKVYFYADGYSGSSGGNFDPLTIFRIGAIYISAVSTSPASLFGGTWTRITGQFLLAATDGGSSGASQAAGNTGGAATVTLTANQSGQRALTISGGGHTHTVQSKTLAGYQAGTNRNGYNATGSGAGSLDPGIAANTGTHTHSVSAAAATEAHNNMPPYLAVYMWRRTA